MNALTTWSPLLTTHGLTVLPQSSVVPLDVWLRDGAARHGEVLRLVARGTTVRLHAYADRDLTVMLVRSECDCESHRTAGAGHRVVLRPGARPLTEHVWDGAALRGWRGVEAGLLRPVDALPILGALLDERRPARARLAAAAG